MHAHPAAPGVDVVAVRTPTLPPATHTNTWILGEGALTVVDPASPWEDEQRRLAGALEARTSRGERVERLFLTHHHADHVGGAIALRDALAARGVHVPIVAHAVTARLLADRVVVDELIDDGDPLECGGRAFRAQHTPGHAPGHVVLQDVESGAMVAGDMVAGVGTILIAADDGGDLGEYLASLEAMRARAPTVLLPAHGPPLPHADALLGFYVAHRHQRTEQIRQALAKTGATRPEDLVPVVYEGLDPAAWPVAAVQIVAHLRWMRAHGLASREGDRWRGA